MSIKPRSGIVLLVALGFVSGLAACGDDEVGHGGWTVEEGDGSATDYGDDTVVVVTPGSPDDSIIVTGNPDECVDIDGACVDLDDAGRYCDETGAQADLVVVDGEVIDVICYPPADDSTDIRDVEPNADGEVEVPQTDSGSVVVFPEDTDGEPVVGDIEVDAERTTIFGNGPDRTTIDGELDIASNNSRVRGVTVTGDLEYDDNSNNSALSFCRIQGDVSVESNGFAALNCQVFGDVEVTGNSALLVNIGVQGEWDVNEGTDCHGCYSFEDANADFLVQPDEVGEDLVCD